MRSTIGQAVGTLREVTAYCAHMGAFHNDGDAWLPFRIPRNATARKFGEFGCCRASERDAYEQGGADFNVEAHT